MGETRPKGHRFGLKMMRNLLVALLLLAGLAVGAMREFLFINLNFQIQHVRYGTPYSYAHSLFRGWVKGWDLAELMRLKWGLAVVLSAAMLGLCILLARLLFGSHAYRMPLAIGYAMAGALAVLLHLAGSFVPQLGIISVKLLHALQYPVMLFLVWAAWLVGGAARQTR